MTTNRNRSKPITIDVEPVEGEAGAYRDETEGRRRGDWFARLAQAGFELAIFAVIAIIVLGVAFITLFALPFILIAAAIAYWMLRGRVKTMRKEAARRGWTFVSVRPAERAR